MQIRLVFRTLLTSTHCCWSCPMSRLPSFDSQLSFKFYHIIANKKVLPLSIQFSTVSSYCYRYFLKIHFMLICQFRQNVMSRILFTRRKMNFEWKVSKSLKNRHHQVTGLAILYQHLQLTSMWALAPVSVYFAIYPHRSSATDGVSTLFDKTLINFHLFASVYLCLMYNVVG